MCLTCVEFQQGKLTAPEARRNLGEMRVDPGHEEYVKLLIDTVEDLDNAAHDWNCDCVECVGDAG